MINLPENYLDTAYVDNIKGAVFIHLKNTANEYFTYYYVLDKAFTFEEHLDRLQHIDVTAKKAYILRDDLTTEFVDPTDQGWVPAPLPGVSIISFVQYQGHARLAHAEDKKALAEGKKSD